MGVSTDGVLFYGYVWEDETELPEAVEEVYGKDEPVLMGYHGSDGWRVPYLYVQGSRIVAGRGHPQEIRPLHMAHDQGKSDWSQLLTDFAAKHEVDLTDVKGPGWFLVSWWG